MGDNSRIEWTDATWNPVFGCSKVSAGCQNCYAESYAKRFRATVPFDTITLHPERLDQPTRWKRPRRIFVGSLSDLFHVGIPNGYRDQVFREMALNSRHTFQVLTKRPDMADAYLDGLIGRGGIWPLRHVWLGVSVELQNQADKRIPTLLKIPADVRFLSVEPMLGPIDGKTIQRGIDWVIVGGESGPNARPMDPDWALALMFACRKAGIPFFMKQLGGWPKKRDTLADFPAELRVREFPERKAAV